MKVELLIKWGNINKGQVINLEGKQLDAAIKAKYVVICDDQSTTEVEKPKEVVVNQPGKRGPKPKNK